MILIFDLFINKCYNDIKLIINKEGSIMKFFKKLYFILIVLLSIFLVSCENTKKDVEEKVDYKYLTVISMNDNHGAIEPNDNNYGMAGISWYINQQRKNKENAVLVLSAGDMFQGTAISNISYGLNMLELMNDIDVKAMTIGNHEFDWGLDTILKYVDGNAENGEATFPFLGCNIIRTDTNEVPELIKEYTVVDFEQFQVGIIGYIGVGLEKDITASMVADYTFVDPTPIVGELAQKLRNDEGCELVIAMGHDASTSTNNAIASLSGDSAVDMIINGHSHTVYNRTLKNGNGKTIPVTQAGTASAYLTDTFFDFTTGSFSTPSSTTVNLGGYDIEPDKEMLSKIAKMTESVDKELGEVIGVAGRSVTRTSVSYWASDQILKYIDCDLAGINSGGIRNSAFPISNGTEITIKKMYEVMPFDNTIKTCKLTGQQLLNVLIITDIVFSKNVERRGTDWYISDELLDVNKTYTFACVDYLYDREADIYSIGVDETYTGILMRDLMIRGLRDIPSGERWLNE